MIGVISILKGEATAPAGRVGVVVTRWNSFITNKLLQAAHEVFISKGMKKADITVVRCPGAFEIPYTAGALLPKVDGIITLGAVIRGQTPHFDYISRAVTDGILQLNLEQDKPVLFGVLTTDTVEQAKDRADQSSNFGNKGAEVALALLEMLSLKNKINKL